LPIAVGFGVKNAQSAQEIAQSADGVVVGSALVDALKRSLDAQDRATADTLKAVSALVSDIASGVRAARKGSSK
jgi:tryptophan synthase alpha chain